MDSSHKEPREVFPTSKTRKHREIEVPGKMPNTHDYLYRQQTVYPAGKATSILLPCVCFRITVVAVDSMTKNHTKSQLRVTRTTSRYVHRYGSSTTEDDYEYEYMIITYFTATGTINRDILKTQDGAKDDRYTLLQHVPKIPTLHIVNIMQGPPTTRSTLSQRHTAIFQ